MIIIIIIMMIIIPKTQKCNCFSKSYHEHSQCFDFPSEKYLKKKM